MGRLVDALRSSRNPESLGIASAQRELLTSASPLAQRPGRVLVRRFLAGAIQLTAIATTASPPLPGAAS